MSGKYLRDTLLNYYIHVGMYSVKNQIRDDDKSSHVVGCVRLAGGGAVTCIKTLNVCVSHTLERFNKLTNKNARQRCRRRRPDCNFVHNTHAHRQGALSFTPPECRVLYITCQSNLKD